MSTAAHNLLKNRAARKERKNLGRGDSKGGNYSGRGIKGQNSRTGGSNKVARRSFMQNLRNVPKLRGFTSLNTKPATVTLEMLSRAFKDEKNPMVTPRILEKRGMVPANTPVKIVLKGDLTVALTIKGCHISAPAAEAVQKAGGKVEAAS